MKKVILWGTGSGSEKILNSLKGTEFRVIAYTDIDKNKHWKKFANNMIYPPEEILKLDFDYIIIASQYEDEIETQILNLKIPKNKIIKGVVKRFKCNAKKFFEFHFKFSAEIANKNFSIISDSCWGGFLYKKIDKKYTSPFLWTAVDNEDYIKILKDLKYYLKQKLEFSFYNKDLIISDAKYPVAKLGDVFIKFPHASSEVEAGNNWNRRLERFNFDNIFVQMSIMSRETAIEFEKLPFTNKVGFTYENYNLNSCIYVPTFYKQFEDEDIRKWYFNQFPNFINNFSYKYFDAIPWLCNKNKVL